MDSTYRAKHLDGTWLSGFFGTLAREALELYRLPYAKAVAASKNFDPLQRMTEVAKEAAQFIGLGNQCGEGWFLTGDMIDLIEKGPNKSYACNHSAAYQTMLQVKAWLKHYQLPTQTCASLLSTTIQAPVQ